MEVFDKIANLRLRDSHVHDVCFMRWLVFDLRVDDGRVGDPCGVRALGARHHVVWEPAITVDNMHFN